MNNEKKSIVKTYSVPLDVLMDILKIVMRNELPNHIEGINVKENIIRLSVKFPNGHIFQNEAKKNIEELLRCYGLYANGSPAEMEGWSESPDGEDEF